MFIRNYNYIFTIATIYILFLNTIINPAAISNRHVSKTIRYFFQKVHIQLSIGTIPYLTY